MCNNVSAFIEPHVSRTRKSQVNNTEVHTFRQVSINWGACNCNNCCSVERRLSAATGASHCIFLHAVSLYNLMHVADLLPLGSPAVTLSLNLSSVLARRTKLSRSMVSVRVDAAKRERMTQSRSLSESKFVSAQQD